MAFDQELFDDIMVRLDECDPGVSDLDYPDRNPDDVNLHLGLVDKRGFAHAKITGGDGKITYELLEMNPAGYDYLKQLRQVKSDQRTKMEFFLKQLSWSKFREFYRKVMDVQSVVLVGGGRPQYTAELLECEKMDPAR